MVNCRWCGGQDHTRMSSKKYEKHSEWKNLKTTEVKRAFQEAECTKSRPSRITKLRRKRLRQVVERQCEAKTLEKNR